MGRPDIKTKQKSLAQNQVEISKTNNLDENLEFSISKNYSHYIWNVSYNLHEYGRDYSKRHTVLHLTKNQNKATRMENYICWKGCEAVRK